jgi:hypothetical protein
MQCETQRHTMSAASYLEHLSDADLAFLTAAAEAPRDRRTGLRAHPEQVASLLAEPAVFAALFGPQPKLMSFPPSPFLTFACVVERAAHELRTTRSVAEPIGGGRRVPVFDVHELREFAGAARLRLFLVELLSSFTHVASGALWVRQRRRWRRLRFSELDLAQLTRLLDLAPPAERPGIYRRLGDLALFLSGVFPDHCTRPLTSSAATERLLRAAGGEAADEGTLGALPLLERLGVRCYRQASPSAAEHTAVLEVLDEVADGFSRARRVLNFITDRYLFTTRERWFTPPS